MRLLLFECFLLSGIACLIGGLIITRKHWRPDVAPFNAKSRAFHIMLNPEEYAEAGQVPRIIRLNRKGIILICAALVIVGYDIFF